MTAGELLRLEASKLRHAYLIDETFSSDRKFEYEREHHYLSCRRCGIEQEAARLDSLTNSTSANSRNSD